jgi:hypothetical protein
MASGLSLLMMSQKVEHCVIHASLHRWNRAAGKLLAGEIGRGVLNQPDHDIGSFANAWRGSAIAAESERHLE